MSLIYPDFFKLCKDWTEFFYSHDMENILSKIKIPEPYYPETEDVFKCFYMTPYKSIKVVILGQDPYHDGSATGLCFEVKKERILNPSLRNIYKELEDEGFYPTKDGCLTDWAKQGVLLLNTTLTVTPKEPESHIKIWSEFFKEVMKKITMLDNVIWIILGKKASEHIEMIPKNHLIFQSTHPSPFSALKSSNTQQAFMGSNIFKNVNEALKKNGMEKIVW